MNRFASVIFWSVIAGAFIGPGTVTTAAKAGAGYALALLWTLLFSTAACLLLQESAARLTVATGRDLAELLRVRFRGAGGIAVVVVVVGAVVLGCAAYEAGNVLGAVAGASRILALPGPVLAAVVGVAAATLLWFGTVAAITRAFGVMVAVMGVAFLVTAWLVAPPLAELVRGALVPALPSGSALLAIGLVGTTVVPYNLFLGSGLARGQDLGTMRFGLAVSVIFGGLISAGVLVVGTAVSGTFSYDALAAVLRARLGGGADLLFAAGLFAAGFSSAVSAPLAAALTCRGLFGGEGSPGWGRTGGWWRVAWGGVLAFGVGFGLAGVQPIPAIVLAQAFNGVMLPAVAVVLLVAANDRILVGGDGLGSGLHLAAMAFAVAVTVVLGLVNLLRAAATVLGLAAPDAATVLLASLALTAVLAVPVGRAVARGRRGCAAREE